MFLKRKEKTEEEKRAELLRECQVEEAYLLKELERAKSEVEEIQRKLKINKKLIKENEPQT